VPASFSSISVTAKLAAYYRQFSDIAFAAEVAQRIDANGAFEQILREHGLEREKLTFYAPMFEARYKSITELIRKSGASQVLELASGYSLRGLDLTRTASIRYVETDLLDVIEAKRGLLEELRQQHALAPSPGHIVAVADALELEQVRAAAAVLDRARPLVVLCEGLIQYLSQREVELLAANLRRLLGEFAGGCWMTPDFAFRAEARGLPPERVRLREAVAGVTQRQLESAAFEDAGELSAFLRRRGFQVEVRSQIDETPAFASLAALGLSPVLLDRFRPVLRVWVMTPALQA
jgi:O-methyltransferase involved in polyketide biosynthesis